MEKYLTKKSVFIAGIVIAVLLVAWMMVSVNDSTTVTESKAKEETVAETKQSKNAVSVKDKQDEAGSSANVESVENAEASLEPSEASVLLPENEIVESVAVVFEGTVPVPPTTVEETEQSLEEDDSQPVIDKEEPSETDNVDAPTDELVDDGSTQLTVIGVTVE